MDPEIGDTECGILLNSLVCASIDQDAQELCAANNSAIYYSLDAYDNDPEIATEMVDPHAAVIDSVRQTENNNVIYYSLDACDNVVTMETFQVPMDRSYTRELCAETDSVQLAAVRVEEQVTQVIASATRAASCRRAPPVAKQGLEPHEGRHAHSKQSNCHSSHSRFLILLAFVLCGIGWLVLRCPRAQQQGILAGVHSRSSASGSARADESEEAQRPAEEPAGAAGMADEVFDRMLEPFNPAIAMEEDELKEAEDAATDLMTLEDLMAQSVAAAAVPSALPQPITPTQEEIDMHNLHHLGVPPWCTSCVESKAREGTRTTG